MSRFVVDSHTLLQVRDKLGRLHDQLLGMHTVIWGYWGTLGGRELEGELEHFCGTWHYGVTEVTGEVDELIGRLQGAAAAYQRIEERIRQAGHDGGAPLTGRSGTGSGTTVIDPGAGHHGSRSGQGSGTTVVGGGAPHAGGSGAASGSGHPSGNGHPTGSGTTVVGGNANGNGHRGTAGRHPAPGGAPIQVSSRLLTGGQETFVAKLAVLTGLSPRVVGAWTMAEESGDPAKERQAQDNNNWLNIGYFDSGAGAIAFDKAFADPTSAAEKTADFLEGKWGGASPSIRAILDSAGKSPDQQMSAIADSDWASSHYGEASNLRATYQELSGLSVRAA